MTDAPDATAGRPSEHPEEPVVIRDKRKIDRTDADRATSAPSAGAEVAQSEAENLLAERTADLQRVQAEYANYRKRAARDQLAAGDLALSRALLELLPVIDSIERARAHGDLTGGLKAVADQLDAIFGKLGLVEFGEVGDRFDPAVHEAVLHAESDEVTEAICTTVMRPGYKHGERLLRAAMVGVSEPSTPSAPTQDDAVTPVPPRENESERSGNPTTQTQPDPNKS